MLTIGALLIHQYEYEGALVKAGYRGYIDLNTESIDKFNPVINQYYPDGVGFVCDKTFPHRVVISPEVFTLFGFEILASIGLMAIGLHLEPTLLNDTLKSNKNK